MSDQILATILSNTYTLTQLKHRVNLLKTYLLSRLFSPSNQETFSQSDVKWLQLLPAAFFNQFDKDNVYQLFEEIHKKIESLRVLTLYLTFDPDEEALSQIGGYVRTNFPNIQLLDIKFDPNLIAGAALSSGGVYKDYSLRTKINERKAVILDNFKKFLLR